MDTSQENFYPTFSPEQKEAVISTMLKLGFEKISDSPLDFRKDPCDRIMVKLVKCCEGPGETNLTLLTHEPSGLATWVWNGDETLEEIQQKLSELTQWLKEDMRLYIQNARQIDDERKKLLNILLSDWAQPKTP